jgi:hypothetical protein
MTIDQRDAKAAHGGIARDSRADDPAADDQHIERGVCEFT